MNNNSHIPLEESSFLSSCAAPVSQALLLGCLGHLSPSSSPLSALHNSSQHAEAFRLKPRQENGGFASCCLNQGADVWCKRNGARNQFKSKSFAPTIWIWNFLWIFACISNDSDPETIAKSLVSLRITTANFSHFLTWFPLYLPELTVLHNLNIRISQFLVWLEVKMHSFKLPASIFRVFFFLSFLFSVLKQTFQWRRRSFRGRRGSVLHRCKVSKETEHFAAWISPLTAS